MRVRCSNARSGDKPVWAACRRARITRRRIRGHETGSDARDAETGSGLTIQLSVGGLCWDVRPDPVSFPLGGRHGDDKRLYVSTGGFSRGARYEADRAKIPLMLMDLDGLVTALMAHYDEADSETRALVPMTCVYWPT